MFFLGFQWRWDPLVYQFLILSAESSQGLRVLMVSRSFIPLHPAFDFKWTYVWKEVVWPRYGNSQALLFFSNNVGLKRRIWLWMSSRCMLHVLALSHIYIYIRILSAQRELSYSSKSISVYMLVRYRNRSDIADNICIQDHRKCRRGK